ncbi:MAG TPA: efflux RND transporter periplasmic adaptor subunit [Kofleriaceae bacterium]|nr:efflux RND transporter periplasmic adaptor subunit [Kofleriaceae bacterium]
MATRTSTLILRLGIAVAVIAGIGWWLHSRGQAAERGRPGGGAGEARAVPVQLGKVEQKDLPIWVEGLGTVAAFQQVTVRAQVDGRLDKVLFVEGQAVKAGDVLAQIDPRPFEVQLHQAEGALARDRAQLDAAQKNYQRYKGLQAQQLVAAQQVESIGAQAGDYEGAIKIDEAAIESAKLNLDYARIKSPIEGVTGVRLVDAGNLVHASDTTGIVVVTALDPAAVFFTVPQDRLPKIAAAQQKGDVAVEVYNRDGSELLGKGTLAVIDNQINQTTATLRLKALVPNKDRQLWPNAFVKARMLVETRRGALVVPAVAVQHGPSGDFVYTVGADMTAQMKPVAVELTTGDTAVLAKGVQPGEQVVTEGANQLRPGSKVQPPGAAPRGGGSGAGPHRGGGSAAPRK